MFVRKTNAFSLIARSVRANRRFFSSEGKITTTGSADGAIKKAEVKPVVAAASTASSSSGGSSFSQRLYSFLAGCGVGFGLNYYFILGQLEESNQQLFKEISNIQNELNKGK